jgi:hypothetical protein
VYHESEKVEAEDVKVEETGCMVVLSLQYSFEKKEARK